MNLSTANATIAALRVELAEARAELAELKRENEQLRSEIHELNETKKRATQGHNWWALHDRGRVTWKRR